MNRLLRNVDKIQSVFGMNTLKGKLNLILLVSAIIPFILVSAESIYSIYSILDNKIQKGVERNLHQVRVTLDNTLDNLYINSQQFLFNGIIGQDLKKLMNSNDTYESAVLTSTINQNMNIFNVSNPLIGLNFYFVPLTGKVIFPNFITRDFKLDDLPVLAESNDIIYNSPHRTLYKYNDSYVFSIIRKVNTLDEPAGPNVLIYIETNDKYFQQIIDQEQYGMRAFHLLIDRDDRIAYSGNPALFQVGAQYQAKQQRQYYSFTEKSGLGWKVTVYVNKSDYSKEIQKWIFRSTIFGILSLFISMLLALQLWRLVMRPLLTIRKGITAVIENQQNDEELTSIGLKEFDFIIQHFNTMRQEINDLIMKVKVEARNRQEIEVEKLMAQINPHFLYNTLNTAQWLARMKGQHEIDRFLSLFTRVLKYNLAKTGIMVSVKEEIQALVDYVELQKVRYDYQFDVRIHVEEQAEDVLLPRFLLQPIVENALYHGIQDTEGLIEVDARVRGNLLIIRVQDNGAGMTEQQIGKLLSGHIHEKDKVGLGIGLNYVEKTMKSYFGELSRLEIQSLVGIGTTIHLSIPAQRKDSQT